MRYASLLFLLACLNLLAVIPVTQSVTLAWNASSTDTNFPVVYRIYEIGLVTTNVVAMVTNAFQVTLQNVLTVPHKWTCTASNYTGESDMSLPLLVPGAPQVPTGLKPVSTTLVVPVPGLIEGSRDLEDWSTKIRLATHVDGVALTQIVTPSEPLMFWRSRMTEARLPPFPK